MANEPSIFDTIEDNETARKRMHYLKRVRTGQITALILSAALVFLCWPVSLSTDVMDTGTFIVSLVYLSFALLSFKWPFPFLLTYSIVSVLFLLSFVVFIMVAWENSLKKGSLTGIVLINAIDLFLILIIVRGTIAAKKHKQLSRQKVKP